MSEWISVDYRLPEFGYAVLVWGCDERPVTAFRLQKPDSNNWEWCDYQTCADTYVGVTHWMLLPNPPKE